MKFDLIIVGNELLNGKITDRNTHTLASELYKRGDTLRKVHIIGDEEELYFLSAPNVGDYCGRLVAYDDNTALREALKAGVTDAAVLARLPASVRSALE